MAKQKLSKNLNDNLKRLSEITDWFDKQEEVDVEAGLEKVKEAVQLIKASKERLKKIENEFEEIKKEVDIEDDEKEGDKTEENGKPEDEIESKDIPYLSHFSLKTGK